MFCFYQKARWLAVLLGLSMAAHAQSDPITIQQSADWREANDVVGQFERGHIDLLQWEAENLSVPAPDAVSDITTWGLSQAIVSAQRLRPDLIARPGMNALERAQLQLQQRSLALEVERSWWAAVAARSRLNRQRQILLAAEVSHELAERMARVGNWPQARQQREHLGHLDAQALLHVAEHEALVAVLALWELTGAPMEPEDLAVRLPADIPRDLPLHEVTSNARAWEQQALARHPEWPLRQRMAQRALARPGDIQALSSAIQSATEPDTRTGLPQSLPMIPNSRWPHSAEKAWEDQLKAQTLERRIRRDVRIALSAWELARQIAMETATEAEQLSAAQEEDMLQRYNGMFKSTWDLLGATRARLEAVQTAETARLSALLAYAEWRAVLDGLPYTGSSPGAPAISASAQPKH